MDWRKVALAKYLVGNGADVNAVDSNQNSPIHKACSISRPIVEFLVEKGANIYKKCEYGNSPMHIAAERGSVSICSFLLEKNVQIEIKNNERIPFLK